MIRNAMFTGAAAAVLASLGVAVVLAQSSAGAKSPLSGWEIVQSDPFVLDPGASAELVAECPAGKVPLGGGFAKAPSVADSEPGFELAASFPAFFTFEGTLFSGWVVHVLNRGAEPASVRVSATCAATRP